MSLTKAIMEFFGKKPGQSFSEFATEVRALTQADRDYLKREFRKIGWDIED